MYKITVFITLVLIVSVAYASNLSCQSCGSECVSACGTRRFRTCCFNYLRRKRGPDAVKFPILQSNRQKFPIFVSEEPDFWSTVSNDYKPSYLDDMIENGLQGYDA
ncbi:uncharacterized protein LOC123878850 [Maniola jurtina]|uniref:uncharacterized protein LOC123878850 n=1 Tax=Maniola jurtina TaxID=191418 RepID=UPI001E68D1C6|nr:uncharacterized protein LOC123878850 [Maniola jurtina]